MRILLVTQWFDPEPTSKGLAFARALRSRGHSVEVLTGFPNYPGGSIYKGYRLLPFQREQMEGVSVARVLLYPSHDKRAVHRVANYVSFGLSALIIGGLVVKRPDVIYVHHPPLTAGVSALLLGSMWRTPVVYDIQDLWPDTLAATGMVASPKILSAVSRLCSWTYRRASAIVVLSSGFREALIKRGVSPRKVRVIMNWSDESQLQLHRDEALASQIDAGRRFNVVFAGTMGHAQGLDNALAAAELLSVEAPDVQFVLVGGGVDVERLIARTEEMGLKNVLFLPRMTMGEIGGVLDAADALLVHLAHEPLFEITIPGKTQAYMAVGKPIVAAVKGDAADLVTEADCGVTCSPGDPRSLADAVLSLERLPASDLRAMGERGINYYRENLSLDVGVDRFIDVFEEVRR